MPPTVGVFTAGEKEWVESAESNKTLLDAVSEPFAEGR